MPEPLPSSSFSLRHEFTLYRLPNCMTAPIITPMGFQYANFEIINIMWCPFAIFWLFNCSIQWSCFMFYFVTSGKRNSAGHWKEQWNKIKSWRRHQMPFKHIKFSCENPEGFFLCSKIDNFNVKHYTWNIWSSILLWWLKIGLICFHFWFEEANLSSIYCARNVFTNSFSSRLSVQVTNLATKNSKSVLTSLTVCCHHWIS